MRKSVIGLSAILLASVATPALAQDEPTPDVTVTATAAVVSDYRFRGVSQTNKRAALQGSITFAHSSGLYATVWGSSIDDYVAAGSDQELDLIAGYSTTVGAATIDVGVLYYWYPGNFAGSNTDFIEPYASIKGTFGPATAKLTVNYAPKQKGLAAYGKDQDNLYVAGDFAATIPDTPIGLTAHIAHSFGPSYLVIGPDNGYTDWSLGATYTWEHLTLGVSYVDTNKSFFPVSANRDAGKAGIVGSLTAAF